MKLFPEMIFQFKSATSVPVHHAGLSILRRVSKHFCVGNLEMKPTLYSMRTGSKQQCGTSNRTSSSHSILATMHVMTSITYPFPAPPTIRVLNLKMDSWH